MIKIGDKAPGFTLFNTEKQSFTIPGDKKSKKVILFFPLAFTGTCTTEMCTMRDALTFYNDLNAEVYGISIDTVFSLKKFKEEQKINFELLSDFNREVCALYGAQYSEFILGMKGVAKRSAFVIDSEGIIRYAEVLETAGDQPNYQAIKDCVSSIH
jgi:peroxiredoxin